MEEILCLFPTPTYPVFLTGKKKCHKYKSGREKLTDAPQKHAEKTLVQMIYYERMKFMSGRGKISKTNAWKYNKKQRWQK